MNYVVSAEKKIAMMTENGFNEAEFITLQKVIMEKHAKAKIISSHLGLIYSDTKNGNGINYAVDHALSETLAIDYDCLIVVGGAEHIETLSDEPHAIRLVRAFLREKMPIFFVSEGSRLLDVIGDKRFSMTSHDKEILIKSDLVFWSVNGRGLLSSFSEFYQIVGSSKAEKDSNNGVAA